MKKYGKPDLAQIAEGCRIFSCSQAVGGRLQSAPTSVTSYRENSTTDETAGGNKEKRSPRITRKDRSHHSYMYLPYVTINNYRCTILGLVSQKS